MQVTRWREEHHEVITPAEGADYYHFNSNRGRITVMVGPDTLRVLVKNDQGIRLEYSVPRLSGADQLFQQLREVEPARGPVLQETLNSHNGLLSG